MFNELQTLLTKDLSDRELLSVVRFVAQCSELSNLERLRLLRSSADKLEGGAV